jgi:hypothetical protein
MAVPAMAMQSILMMNVFTFGLARSTPWKTIVSLLRPPTIATVPGLIHAELLTPMRLGSPILSPHRMQLGTLTMFAAWESEEAIENFLAKTKLGRTMATGWHLRMSFLRRWGSVREFADLPETAGESDPAAPVAAYTLARLKIPEVPRFIHWGRPVEELVRDHPETTFALAAFRFPRTIATFSVWNSLQAMRDMVRGHSEVAKPERHAAAMVERNRRDFHREFTTLRFRPLSEHGSWNGSSSFVRPYG